MSDGTGNIIQIKYLDGLATIPLDEFTLNSTTHYDNTVCVNKMGKNNYLFQTYYITILINWARLQTKIKLSVIIIVL